ncbi:class I SAM-dependent methyltransferase [Actinophytocola sp.]|uniref:class I SAM-dependent methyltransferase n=1 Tax=Actinophytocola sp. TaxID=1872138 RepID=UPI002D810DDE|nr:class I SAM-dependent methyltransferase [Actinophytocola sp.]HET9144260.1 class I SAM-dependent methyltransferase [Actinophytocola sp.]
MSVCRICAGPVSEFADFGAQPLSDAFRLPDEVSEEFFFRLAVGMCSACTMVQLIEEVPRELMFHAGYPYYSSGSAVMRAHFERTAHRFLDHAGPDGLIVEVGCNDGAMLHVVAEAGRRHVGIEPSGAVAAVAAQRGVRVRGDFFDADVAADIRATDGPAQVIFAANTLCHIPYVDSVLFGVAELLAPDGMFVFEDPYFADILAQTSFDQIYDEHFYFFTARSVAALAGRHGLRLVDVERLPVHGGEVRYTLMRAGAREPSAAVADLLAAESAARITEEVTLKQFRTGVERIRDDLTGLLTRLRAQGHTVAGYGATAKSATVTNFCGIGPDLVSYICDTTPAKQGRLSPGAHIPVRPHETFAAGPPDYALLFAWNHAAEIMANEREFSRRGGRWIRYVPTVRAD